ncbi:Ig-like domain-containing protein [Pedobacter sp. SYSU D00535]|uniref:Ig-like domain-containing protein n=1 Tax=Pedobacter sp. SYSU D00535 TaxID=2810308 RepID=UPI001A9606DF|nr:Ig-like domain-containing protein [Pedobacter sp. SYSU D00535]
MAKYLRAVLFFAFFIYAGDLLAQFPFYESFMGPTAKNLVFGGEPTAYLTSGINDPDGQGYLRLTNKDNNQTGYVVCNAVFPSTKGFSVEFEYFTHGNNDIYYPGADGICFFMFDATANPFNIGAFGGALGYAQRYLAEPGKPVVHLPGVSKGYIGVGLDEWGNYAKAFEGKVGGLSYKTEHQVVIRGAGDGKDTVNNYPYLTSRKTVDLPTPFHLNGANREAVNENINGYRKAIFELQPRPGGGYFVTVKIRYNSGGVINTATVIDNFEYTTPAPPFLKFGFGSSTGGTNNYHEIRNLSINLPGDANVPPPTPKDDSFTVGQGDLSGTVKLAATANDEPGDPSGAIDKASIDFDATTPGIQSSLLVPGRGTFKADSEGNVTFIPVDATVTGSVSVKYSINDLYSQTSPTQASITVLINRSPTAVDDNVAAFLQGTSSTFSVTANDTDPESDAINPASIDLDPSTLAEDKTKVVANEGTYQANNDGTVTFTPLAGFYGNATPITYTIKDAFGAVSNAATITTKVTALYQPPVTAPDSKSTDEDTPVTFNILANDTNGDGTIVPSTVDLNPATPEEEKTFYVVNEGTYTVDNLGNVTFTPLTNFKGIVNTTNYTVKDNTGVVSKPTAINVTVNSVNDAPVITFINETTAEDTPVTFGLPLALDADGTVNLSTIDLDPSTVAEEKTFTVAGKGTFEAKPDGKITFTPVLNFTGTVGPVKYTVKDNEGAVSNIENITVTVTPANDAPTVANQNLKTNENTALTINLISTFADIDGTPDLSSIVTTGLTHGTLTSNGDGTFKYQPNTGYFGLDGFNYSIKDNDGILSNSARVSITVNGRPFAARDYKNVNENSAPVIINLAANDSDPENALNLASIVVSNISNLGEVGVKADGTVEYKPKHGYHGEETFTYTIKDAEGFESNSGIVTILINALPVARDDAFKYTAAGPNELFILNNDNDPTLTGRLDVASVTFSTPANGTLTLNTDGSVRYTPKSGYQGPDSFTYTVKDNEGAVSNVATVNLTFNPAPVARNDEGYFLKRDTEITIPVLDNDTDNHALDRTTIQATNGTIGTTSVNPDGTVKYQPYPGQFGNDTFTYTVKDQEGARSNVATVKVKVVPAPIAVDDFNNKVNPGASTEIFVKANDFAVDGTIDLATITIKTPPAHGNAVLIDNTSGKVRFTPTPGYSGPDRFTYTIKDTYGYESIPATVHITINAPPIADDITSIKVNSGSEVVIDVIPFTRDLDNSGINRGSVAVKDATNASFVGVNPTTGAVTYRPQPGWYGNATLKYSVKDNDGAESNVATVSIRVNGPPVTKDDGLIRLNAGSAIDIDVLQNDFDSDAATLTGASIFPVKPANGTVVVNNGKVRFTPDPGFSGSETFSYTIKDADGAESNISTVTLRVNALPIANNDLISTEFNRPVTIRILDNDTDKEGPLELTSVIVITQPLHGTLRVDPDGSVYYTPNAGYHGPDFFRYTVKDLDVAASNEARADITVHPPTKLGLAKKLASLNKAVNGSYDAKFLFTLVNFGSDQLEKVSLTDDLASALAGSTFAVKSVTTSGGLVANTNYDGKTTIEMLNPTSTLAGNSTATVELVVNIKMENEEKATFQNSAFATGQSSRNGIITKDQSTDGTKPDVTSPGDVTSAISTEIVVEKPKQFIPAGFSPNGDGTNDNFVIENTGNNRISLEIFNRWGNRVYRSSDYKNDWDGRCTEGVRLGEYVPDGTYYYIVNIETVGKQVGYITIKR